MAQRPGSGPAPVSDTEAPLLAPEWPETSQSHGVSPSGSYRPLTGGPSASASGAGLRAPLQAACLAACVLVSLPLILHMDMGLGPRPPPLLQGHPTLVTTTSASSASNGDSITAPAPVRFLALGDWGRNGTFNQTLVATQMGMVGERLQAQFVVSTGDNFYEEGLAHEDAEEFEQSFSNVYTHPSLQVPWYAVLGNHDYYGDALAQLSPRLMNRDLRWKCARSSRLTLPLCSREATQGTPLSVAAPPLDMCSKSLDVFLYDTTPLVRNYRQKKDHHLDWRGLNSANWTAQEEAQFQELEGWLKSSSATWKIVVGHHPVYSFGHHGDQQEMIDSVNPLLKKYGVDVYMNGHDHDIQHIKRADSPVHYVTNGGGSKAWRETAPPASTPGLEYFWPGQGFGAFEVSEGLLKASFYGVRGDLLHSLLLEK